MAFRSILAVGLALVLVGCSGKPSSPDAPDIKENKMGLANVTPVLLATELEPCVEFWKGLGFDTEITVPFQDELAFVSLQNGSLEIMYQSIAFSKATNPAGIDGVNRSIIFLETDELDEIVEVVEKYDVVTPDHITDRGSREIWVRDPAGNLIGFAQNLP